MSIVTTYQDSDIADIGAGEVQAPASSYLEAVADPGTEPTADPVICLRINSSWIPYVIGCVLQLSQPATWQVDTAALPDLLGRVQDLINIIGTSEACVAPEFRLTSGCGLQYSLDGGTTWLDFTDWSANFPNCVKVVQAYVVMDPAYSHPPIPEQTVDGTDWLYS